MVSIRASQGPATDHHASQEMISCSAGISRHLQAYHVRAQIIIP